MPSHRVGVRELRNKGRDVLGRVQAGTRFIVTKSGRPIAELGPLRAPAVDRGELLTRWRHIPEVDAEALRSDLDDILDSGL